MFESSVVIRDDDDDDDDDDYDKGKILPRTGHERPKEEHKCSSTLSLTSAPGGGGSQHHAPTAICLSRMIVLHFTFFLVLLCASN